VQRKKRAGEHTNAHAQKREGHKTTSAIKWEPFKVWCFVMKQHWQQGTGDRRQETGDRRQETSSLHGLQKPDNSRYHTNENNN